MSEQREGQEIIRFYVSKERKEKFKLYCQFNGTSMTEYLIDAMEKAIASEDFAEVLALWEQKNSA